MICINCQNELNEKATKRKKYCSDSCRVSAYIKRSGYKPLGNIKNANLGQIETKENQFKPNNENSFNKQFIPALAAVTTVETFKHFFSTEKLSKDDFEKFRTELKKDLVNINSWQKAIYKLLNPKSDIQR